MKTEIKISCPKNCDQVVYDAERFGVQPGLDFGINKTRFLVVPRIFCVKCNSLCKTELIQTEEKVETKIIVKTTELI